MMILARSSSFSYKTRLGVQKMESLLRRRSWFGVQAKESQEWTSGIGAAFFFELSYPIDNVVRSFFIPKGKQVFLNALFLGVMTATSIIYLQSCFVQNVRVRRPLNPRRMPPSPPLFSLPSPKMPTR